jgi:ADP-ribose pyrophosphatase
MRDDFELPSGKMGEYHYVHTNGSAMIVATLDDGRVLTVRQYRYLLERDSLEFPCGAVKDGESYEETARHELTEETGHSAGRLVFAGQFNPYNGMTDEMCRVYLASDLYPAVATPDETEEFELIPLVGDQIEQYIRDGTIWDGMTIAAWHIVRHRLDRARSR